MKALDDFDAVAEQPRTSGLREAPTSGAGDNLAVFIEWIGKAAAFLILPNLAIVILEVVLRYALDRPTVWVNETSQFLFGFSFLLGGALTLARGGHVRVDVVLHVMRPPVRAWVELFAYPFIFFYLAVVLWICGASAWASVVALERTDSAWGPYVFPLYAAVPVAVLLMLVQAVLLLIRDFRLAVRSST